MHKTRDALNAQFGDAIVETGEFRGDQWAVVARERIVDICRFLRDEHGFSTLMDLCAVDYPERAERFEVVYHLYALERGTRLRLKIRLPAHEASAPTVTAVWRAANWFEREAFDLFGIRFDGHPNLRRLLTFEGFEGHPLRKDYPKNKRQPIPRPDPLVHDRAQSEAGDG